VALTVQVGLWLTTQGVFAGSGIYAVFAIVCAQLVPIAALTVFPFAQKEAFSRTVGFVRWKIGPLPVISLIGGLALVYMAVVLALLILYPNPITAVKPSEWILLAAITGMGAAWYGYRGFADRKKKGRIQEEAQG
jgi:hypothetical protein